MSNRMVGVTGVNLMSLYYTAFVMANASGVQVEPTGIDGVYDLESAPSAVAFCVEPVQSITVGAAITADIYFVPAFDFAGITINGTASDVSAVNADGKTLYKVSSAGAVTQVSL